MKRFFTLLLLLLLLSGLKPAQAQTDTEFWFAVPKLTQSHDWANRKFFFRFATMNLPATIVISMPANPDFVPIYLDVPANTALTVPLAAVNPGDTFFQMWNENPNQIYNRGIRISATNLITAYFEVGTNNNPDIFSLKGRNALGKEFFVPFQAIHFNEPLPLRPYSAIYIVATEDNTQVTVTPTRPVFPSRPAGVPFVVTLHRGQSYGVAPDYYTGVGNLAANHLGGTRVQSDKPIAIATSDDSVRGLPGPCYDLIGDQIIPTSIIGTEYIAMRSRLTIPEGFYVLATEVDTDVFIDGDLIVRLQPGEQHRYEFTQQNHFIETTSPSYVYHVAGFGCEQGGAVLPPINVCTGSTQVSFTRSLGGANGRLFLNILVQAGAQDGFIFNGDGPNTLINAADFQVVPGTTQWLAAEYEFSDPGIVPVAQSSLIENIKDVFHLGIINGGPSTGVMYGYFSDFNELEVKANISGSGTSKYICFGESVQLIAQGGTHYQWHPPDYLDDPTSPTPISFPETDIKYVVTVSGACNLIDSTSVFVRVVDPVIAAYTVNAGVGCAPLEVSFENNSLGAATYHWDFGDGSSSTMESPMHVFVNNTDTEIIYTVMLTAVSQYGCTDMLENSITVYPDIIADFDVVTSGCHPLEVSFENNSLGAATYHWDFGDGSSSNLESPMHVFENFSHTQQQTFQVRLNAESYYGCKDSTLVTITVNPLPKAIFQPASTEGCSPLLVVFYDFSIGAQSWQWDFGDGNTSAQSGDTSHTYYQTYDQEPGVFSAQLQVANTWGCSDTASRQVTVFPDVVADFEPSVFEGNNPLTVSFTNFSEGAHIFFWDFDGAADSSSDENPVTWFHNPSTSDTAVFNVLLLASSHYGCLDEKTVQIQVYPRITDLEAGSINGNTTPAVGVESMYTVQLLNRGSAVVPGADYTVELVDADNNVLANVPGVDVNPSQTVAVLVPFTPTEAGPLAVRGFINLPGDGSPADYYTGVLNLIVTEYYTDIQIIHNAADAAVAAVDIYVGDELFLENVAFRTATPFIEVRADIELEFFVAPAGAGIANAVGPVAVTFSKDLKYVVVANGIVSATGYDPVKPFALYPFGNAREEALQAANVDLLVFHGATDAPGVSIFAQGIANQLFAFEYGEFEGYLELPVLDYVMEVKDIASGNSIAMFSAPLQSLDLEGEAVVVVASGFLDPANNSNGADFGLWATTAAGGALIQLQNVTSVNVNVVMDGGVSMFPNPTSGLVTLQSANMMREVKVFDLSGRAVYATTQETNEYQINARAFNNGIYFVQVITSEGIFVSKLLVQK